MGISSGMWPLLEQVRRHQKLMDRMMVTSGVDMYSAARVDGGLAFFEASTKCRLCRHEASCVLWLEAAEGLESPPDFCPNAGFFKKCRTIDQ